MAKQKTDDKTLLLIEEIKKRKAEIIAAEKPNWKTNCSFSYEEGSAKTINLHVESSLDKLLKIGAFLTTLSEKYNQLAKELDLDNQFKWAGFSLQDWLYDIKTRINKIHIESKKNKLAILENRLNAIISPELKAQLELEAIEKELQSN